MKKEPFERILWAVGVSALVSLGSTEQKPYATPTKEKSQLKFENTFFHAEPPETGEQILVAVVDTGMDPDHPLLKDFLWTNPGESGVDDRGFDRATNRKDDDGNGFVDDVHGWNFVDQNANISDEHGHGTHIAGLVTEGLKKSSKIRIMILKYYGSQGAGAATLNASNQAIAYAVHNGAKIINYSGGGDLPGPTEEHLFRQAFEKDIAVVAASGNDGRETDAAGFFPASYDFPNILSVASLDSNNHLLPSSNRGPDSVDTATLGKDVLSTLPHDRKGFMTGTSQATALMTGMLAQIYEQYPQHSLEENFKRLLQSAQPNENLRGQVRIPRTPKLDRALKMRSANEISPRFQLNQKVTLIHDPLIEEEVHIQKDLAPANRGALP